MPRKSKSDNTPAITPRLDYNALAALYRRCLSWDDVAKATPALRTGGVGELKRIMATDPAAPALTLERWGEALEAEAKITCDGRPLVDPLAFLCHDCPASELFRGGHSVEDVAVLLGGLDCPRAADCRKKAMVAEKIYLRQAQSVKAIVDSKMAQYLGKVILHQEDGALEDFKPVEIIIE